MVSSSLFHSSIKTFTFFFAFHVGPYFEERSCFDLHFAIVRFFNLDFNLLLQSKK